MAIPSTHRPQPDLRTRFGTVALLGVGLALLLAQPTVRATAPPSLKFFKNYFITGDTVVGGTSLWRKGVHGVATRTVQVSGVPANVDVVAAFLYVQSAEKAAGSGIAGAAFAGFSLDSSAGSLAKALNAGGSPPWWGYGAPGWRKLVTYRADVLRFLPIDPVSGRIVANGSFQVKVPDTGNDDCFDDDDSHEYPNRYGPHAVGASLVVVYRNPSMPLKAIVIYDGLATKGPLDTWTLPIEGFYQASSVSPLATMTHIVGGGHSTLSEKLKFNGALVATNPFQGTSGTRWDNPRFPVTVPGNAASATVSVEPNGWFSDAMSWSAVVFSTTVQDTDGDGLLDVWESSAATLFDPNDQPLPNLASMGANPLHKDVFVEIGSMHANDGTTYGGVPKPEHSHLPTADAIKMIGDAFAKAPVNNPDLLPGIKLHLDVGDHYQSGDAATYVLPTGLARGGEVIDEMVTVCHRLATDPPSVCQFSEYPGTVGWKTGFAFIRDGLLSATPPPLDSNGNDPCDAPGNDGPGQPCERRFDANRKDMFRYALFAHAVGLPKDACLLKDGLGNELSPPQSDLQCDTPGHPNPDFHVPRTNSGVGDFPGGDLMVTLGGFPDTAGLPVGTAFMQGATLMHELGHGFEFTHAGTPPPAPLAQEPNCKPNYLSVMNYLFQLRGLYDDDPLHAGVPQMDFSGEILGGLNEPFLVDGALAGTPRYRTGWYAPQGPGTIGSPAKKYCTGFDFPNPLPAGQVPMVRVDSVSVLGAIDWNLNGILGTEAQDINFDGLVGPLNAGSNDWANIRLNQLGSRRSPGGFFMLGDLLAMGPLSLDVGRGDIGRGDIGRGDIGRGDIGRGDIGRGDIGRGDIGRGDIGRGDIGRGDIGRGDIGADQEIDDVIASAAGNTPPNALTACVLGGTAGENGCGVGATPFHRIRLNWKAPNIGGVAQYRVYRNAGNGINPAIAVQVGAPVPANGSADYSTIDTQELPNAFFTYFVIAEFADDDNTVSGPSNPAVIMAVNYAPVANADPTYSMTQGSTLTVVTPQVLGNDTDVDSATLTASLVVPPAHGALVLNPNGSFTYTPTPSFFGTETFTYAARDVDPSRTSNVTTVTITVVQAGYEFVNVKNLPPPAGVKFKPSFFGTLVDFEWRFKKGGVVANSWDAKPSVTITGPGGYSKTFSQIGGDCTFFEYNPFTNTWVFFWIPRNAAVGTYYAIVKSAKTGQRFPDSGPGFPIVFSNY